VQNPPGSCLRILRKVATVEQSWVCTEGNHLHNDNTHFCLSVLLYWNRYLKCKSAVEILLAGQYKFIYSIHRFTTELEPDLPVTGLQRSVILSWFGSDNQSVSQTPDSARQTYKVYTVQKKSSPYDLMQITLQGFILVVALLVRSWFKTLHSCNSHTQ